ncbi:hypothetical protein V8C44DRAFT_365252 [Trichoderma aethiopicum]
MDTNNHTTSGQDSDVGMQILDKGMPTPAPDVAPAARPLHIAMFQAIELMKRRIEQLEQGHVAATPTERARYGMLLGACHNMDPVFLILHQQYCCWLLDRRAAYARFPIQPTVIDAAFGELYKLFQDGERLSPPHRLWCSRYPGFGGNVVGLDRVYCQVQEFITMFAIRWPHALAATMSKKVPLMAFQIRDWFSCTSPTIANTLFTYIRRAIGVPNGPLAVDLNHLFNMDNRQERAFEEQNVSPEERAGIRSTVLRSYLVVVQKAQMQRANLAAIATTATPKGSHRVHHNSRSSLFLNKTQSTKHRLPWLVVSLTKLFRMLLLKPLLSFLNLARAPTVVLDLDHWDRPSWSIRAFYPQRYHRETNRYHLWDNYQGSIRIRMLPTPLRLYLLLLLPNLSRLPLLYLVGTLPFLRVLLSLIIPRPLLCLLPLPSILLLLRSHKSPNALNTLLHPLVTSSILLLNLPPILRIHRSPKMRSTRKQFKTSSNRLFFSTFYTLNNTNIPSSISSKFSITSSSGTPSIRSIFSISNSFGTTSGSNSTPGSSCTFSSNCTLGSNSMLNSSSSLNSNSSSLNINSSSLNINSSSLNINRSSLNINSSSLNINSSSLNINSSSLNINRSSLNINSSSLNINSSSLNSNSKPVFFSAFAVEPREVLPQTGVTVLNFDVTQEEMDRLSITSRPPASPLDDPLITPLPVSRYFNDSLRYRLRMIIARKKESPTTIDAATWSRRGSYWPPHIFISINEKILHIRRKQHFHHDLPLELTDSLAKGTNKIKVSLPLFPQNLVHDIAYFMAVERIVTLDHDSVWDMVLSGPHVDEEATKKEICRRLTGLDTDEIVIESDALTVSVADQFSSTLFDVPVRGRNCRHLECFDLGHWLMTRPSKPSQGQGEPTTVDCWACPMCGSDARPCNVQVDDFFADVAKKLLASGNTGVRQIEVLADGSWKAIEEGNEVEELSDSESAKQSPPTRVKIQEITPETVE